MTCWYFFWYYHQQPLCLNIVVKVSQTGHVHYHHFRNMKAIVYLDWAKNTELINFNGGLVGSSYVLKLVPASVALRSHVSCHKIPPYHCHHREWRTAESLEFSFKCADSFKLLLLLCEYIKVKALYWGSFFLLLFFLKVDHFWPLERVFKCHHHISKHILKSHTWAGILFKYSEHSTAEFLFLNCGLLFTFHAGCFLNIV